MNINDFPSVPTPPDWQGVVRAIFQRQGELMLKYQTIEQLPPPPLIVHLAASQRILKDFAWRVTEELTEAYEAMQKHHDDIAREHAHEELADALHFLVELLIFVGITPDECIDTLPNGLPPSPVHNNKLGAYWSAVYELGLAMNFLRNKPWKQSQVPVDEARFRLKLLDSWVALMGVFAAHQLTNDRVFDYYFRKSEVNKLRQRSNY